MTDTDSKEGGRGTSDRLESREQWAVGGEGQGTDGHGKPREERKVRGHLHFQR